MFKSRLLLCIAASCLLGSVAVADDRGMSIGIYGAPSVSIPIGNKAYAYSTGYGGQLAGIAAPSTLPWLNPLIDFTYEYVPINIGSSAALSIMRATAGARATMLFGERLSVYGQLALGGYVAVTTGMEAPTAANASLLAGIGVGFQLMNDVSLTGGMQFATCFGTYDSISAHLGITARLAGTGSGAVPLREVAPLRRADTPLTGFVDMTGLVLAPVYPVLRKYYDSHPVGQVTLTNVSDADLEDVEVRLRPAAFIDSPKLSARIADLPVGESEVVDLYVLFNESILGVTEEDKIVTDVEVTYRVGDRQGADLETVTLDTHNRNAMSWDDDEKIAAFVTSRDEEIQRFARHVASIAQSAGLGTISPELQLGMLIHSAIAEQGVAYAVDPLSSYAELSEDSVAVDYVQFPRQTLYVRGGDCDDLSATFCALMQAVGVNAAFITVPEHIFAAFQLQMSVSEARSTFTNLDQLIFRDDTVWVPVETTVLSDGFVAAWAAGAHEWNADSANGTADFFTVADAWETYDAVAFGVSQIELSLPDANAIRTRFRNELDTFIGREVGPREESLLARLRTNPGNARLRNNLGILYARYGDLDAARAQFQAAVDSNGYVPSMVNLANVWFVSGEFREALQMYQRVLATESDNPIALLGFARAEYELGHFASAQQAHDRLAAIEPDLAAEFPYLGSSDSNESAARSSGYVNQAPPVIWEDE